MFPFLVPCVEPVSSVSHHPPISAYFYITPANHVRISGELKPKSRFLGNSVSTVMDGENRIFLTKRPEDGGMCLFDMKALYLSVNVEYCIGLPNMYARGILFGSMILELGDTISAVGENTDMSCNVEFKTKVIYKCHVVHLLCYV